MEGTLKEQLRILVELQDIDSSILSIADKIDSYPGKIEKFQAPLKKSQDAFQKFTSQSDALNKKKKEKERELDDIQDKISKLKARSSEIKTNKEYEAHLKEIESFEKKRYSMEDGILAIMEDLENFEDEVRKEGLKVKESEAEFNRQKQLFDEEQQKILKEQEALKEKRKEFVSQLDEDIYHEYKTLLTRMGGLAVVQVRNEVCLGCNTNIPPQLYNEIREKGTIYHCFYCNRFLYFKEPDQPANPSQTPPPGQ